MPRRRQRSGWTINAEVNMTSLVDVAFTLLVIFIITAPMLQGGIEVQVPRARTESVPSNEGLVVSIDREGQIYVGEALTAWEEFESAFPEIVRERGVRNVYLRADGAVPYERVAQVLGAMKGSDLASVGLIAQPEPVARRN
jgi:biopolymer transport protein TolR